MFTDSCNLKKMLETHSVSSTFFIPIKTYFPSTVIIFGGIFDFESTHGFIDLSQNGCVVVFAVIKENIRITKDDFLNMALLLF